LQFSSRALRKSNWDIRLEDWERLGSPRMRRDSSFESNLWLLRKFCYSLRSDSVLPVTQEIKTGGNEDPERLRGGALAVLRGGVLWRSSPSSKLAIRF
jgi:hypothetical protein